SVSRVGSSAQTKIVKKLAGSVKLDLAQFEELQAFAQFGSDLDAATKAKLERGSRIVELFKQGQYEPKSLGIEVINLYAIQRGYLDDVPVADIRRVRAELEEEASVNAADLLAAIETEKTLTDDIDARLKALMIAFKNSRKH
ncbi:MAG: F0F1 ATP synthase subunit alpha, partial [Akkermansia sp.]